MDFFGEPISLYYKGENSFTTRVGGICSIIWIGLVLTNLGIQLYQLAKGTNFAQQVSYDYVPIGADKKQEWHLETKFETVAALIEPINLTEDSADPETLARVQFYVWTLAEENTNIHNPKMTSNFVPAVRCQDYYADKIDPNSESYSPTIEREFKDPNWICPNVTDFYLLNNPLMLHTVGGTNFVMVVNPCNKALQMDQTMIDRGLSDVSYSDKTC